MQAAQGFFKAATPSLEGPIEGLKSNFSGGNVAL